ncbi:MAG: acyl-CoA dehydratase activase-related protein [Coriobacteriales bacterium]|jgi:predicted CoA-substrate-specific enzyme activase
MTADSLENRAPAPGEPLPANPSHEPEDAVAPQGTEPAQAAPGRPDREAATAPDGGATSAGSPAGPGRPGAFPAPASPASLESEMDTARRAPAPLSIEETQAIREAFADAMVAGGCGRTGVDATFGADGDLTDHLAARSMRARAESDAQAEAEAETSVEITPGPGLDWSGRDLHLGIDVGSTTVKLAVLDEDYRIVYASYQRHHTDVRATAKALFRAAEKVFGDARLSVAITGSGGLLLSQWLGMEFVQEVIASKAAVKRYIPQTDVAIELGGEDAKIIYFDNGIEQRMNGTCAGGTGAFIDQMASLLHTDAAGLNELAKSSTMIYPIASRCGVFAKTDIQPLLNEGAAPADLAASIFQSIVTQTISGLACGRPIRGHVAFLGGPLQYLSELRKRFRVTLDLDDEHMICPENAHLFVASGAALAAVSDKKTSFPEVIAALDALGDVQGSEVQRLAPLFPTQADRDEFDARHGAQVVPKGDVSTYHGRVYIGIDAGSTTMKGAIIGEDGELLKTWYGPNRGDVLGTARQLMDEFYDALNPDCTIGHVTCTGYGEGLLIEALHADSGEIETVAHLRSANEVLPGVEFILDVGGQDMKCLQVKNGVIEHIMLNEACSSGCGSFLSAFADSMGMSIQDFAASALTARHPVDLGSRCTVFMNSRVKQAQKEGASVGDISAGLSYSVMKNALFKVIKLRDVSQIGSKAIVQGGTFLNDAVLRAFENLTGVHAYRPDIAGCMGCYGAALLARDRAHAALRASRDAAAKTGAQVTEPVSTILSREQIDNLKVEHKSAHCGLCANNCLLTISIFGKGRRFVTGNRCERGAGAKKGASEAPNLFEYKNKRLFGYEPLPLERAPRGTVGIPRALNMYEDYPFWFTMFTELGFRVELSGISSKKVYEAGIESMPSESVCYPAKLSHGHVMQLIDRGVDFIWMPSVRWERKEDPAANNCYNCPIVMSYPTALKLNIDDLRTRHVEFCNDFMPYNDRKELKRRVWEVVDGKRWADAQQGIGRYRGPRITRAEVDRAVDAAWEEADRFHDDMHRAGERTLAWMEEHKAHGIVIAGRPYHNDREINHSIPELVNSFGFAVLTEDSISHLHRPERDIRVVDQWMYHSRLYAAARYVATRNDLDLIQLNSFGCGLDALTTDEVQEILESNGKIYTVLKIDEVSNLGAARIRVRSLIAALNDKHEELLAQAREQAVARGEDPDQAQVPVHRASKSVAFPKVQYTEQMRQDGYTILCPQMAPIHFDLVKEVFHANGYNLELLPSVDHGAVDAGLKYVNNDICYPSILVTGQIMEAVESGRYDLDRTAVLITQTGGGCRATNYIALIRKALKDSGHGNIPVISLAVAHTGENNPGFKITLPMLRSGFLCIIFGDVIMQCLYRTRPYEAVPGSADALYEKWMAVAREQAPTFTRDSMAELARKVVADFDELPLVDDGSKPRVGVVGEILVKFHPTANNQVVRVIESEGCEAVVPGLMDFFNFGLAGARNQKEELGAPAKKLIGRGSVLKISNWMRAPINKILRESKRFEPYSDIYDLGEKAKTILSLCNNMGEGWLLTAEMVELIEQGTPNIVCAQPFACLPNHVVGKATIKEIRRQHPESNIVAVDYDPGSSEVNQLNRIKLMISVAKENFGRANPQWAAKNGVKLDA